MEQMTTWSFNKARIHKNRLRCLTIHLCSRRCPNHHASLHRWHDAGIQIGSSPRHLCDRTWKTFQNVRPCTNNSTAGYQDWLQSLTPVNITIPTLIHCWDTSKIPYGKLQTSLNSNGTRTTTVKWNVPKEWRRTDSHEDHSISCSHGIHEVPQMTTRPDIVYVAGALARFGSNPRIAHWNTVKHLLRYLQGTASYALTYSPDNTSKEPFTAFSDANHGRCKDSGWLT